MQVYRRVAYEDRCQIQAFLQAEIAIPEMARTIGFHKSTIYRELGRYRKLRGRGYDPKRANGYANVRRRSCRRPFVIAGELEGWIGNQLYSGWSPQYISGRLRKEGSYQVSHETIYRYIYRQWSIYKHCLRRYNKRGGSRCRMKKYRMPDNKTLIHTRPEIANQRRRIGDWERDTMYVANRRQILVCTDRKSRFIKIAKLHNLDSQSISALTWKVLRSTRKKVYTITNDNGPEFRATSIKGVPIYYCDPRKPQQRGTVENCIGQLRQYIRRNTHFRQLSRARLKDIEAALNFRPRKCLDYLTPYEVFYDTRVALAI